MSNSVDDGFSGVYMPLSILRDNRLNWRERCIVALCLQEIERNGILDYEKCAKLTQTTYSTFCARVSKLIKHRHIPESRHGFIYLVRSGSTGLHKIGFSKTPLRREQQLKRADKTSHMIWHSSDSHTMLMEATLHERFHEKCRGGEWFDLSDEDVNFIKENV